MTAKRETRYRPYTLILTERVGLHRCLFVFFSSIIIATVKCHIALKLSVSAVVTGCFFLCLFILSSSGPDAAMCYAQVRPPQLNGSEDRRWGY